MRVCLLAISVLSAFEESSAACISDMLRQVSNGQYLEAIRMAEKFILHVEVLFATIDDLEYQFGRLKVKGKIHALLRTPKFLDELTEFGYRVGMSHVREARMLCRKTVDLFTLLSHTQDPGARRMGVTQELLALVTGLAHYLKILIRIALTGALKLEREQDVRDAIGAFLDKLHMLAIQGANPSAKRLLKRANGEVVVASPANPQGAADGAAGNVGTQGVTYGFRSLAPDNAGESPFSAAPRDPALAKVSVVNPPSDLCVKCNLTVEEDCVRLGTYQRWHSHCLQCNACGKAAAVSVPAVKDSSPPPKSPEERDKGDGSNGGNGNGTPKVSTARRPPANVGLFVYDADSMKDTTSFGLVPTVIFCTEHAHAGCRPGFQAVSRLEQYAFLLNVALRRLYVLLKKRGVVPMSPGMSPSPFCQVFVYLFQTFGCTSSLLVVSSTSQPQIDDPYRNSQDINRLKSVHVGRKLSATARVPRKSTVVESPAGKVAHSLNVLHSQRSQDLVSAPQSLVPSLPPPSSQSSQSQSQSGQRPPPPQGTPSGARTPKIQQQQSRSRPLSPATIDTSVMQGYGEIQSQIIRPPFARNNTAVMIVDDSAPTSPTAGPEEPSMVDVEDSITLADIPQIVEAAQAREQHRSLPRQSSIPYIAELNPLELAIVKHFAVLAVHRSPLRDQFDLDEILELVEAKKSSFWKQLFKAGNDKKNVKKKGMHGDAFDPLIH